MLACAFTSGNEDEKKEAFNLARSCFQALLDSPNMEPDVSSFANFFIVIARHLKHGDIRDKFAEAVFTEGCNQGKIDKQVMYQFRKASPASAEKILSPYKDFLPREWRRNIGTGGYKKHRNSNGEG